MRCMERRMSMNKNSIIPLYQQLADTIKQQILNGELKENDKLMTEFELSQAYGVSRITVRKAVELLVEEGYVTKRQGIGTFVAAKKLNRVMNKLASFTEMCEQDGKIPTTELVSLEWLNASVPVSQKLQVTEGDRVLKIVRIRKSDGEPVMLEESYFRGKYSFLMSENLTGSTYEVLRNHNTIPSHAVKTVEICYATKQEAQALSVKESQALLLHRDVVMDEAGEPIHYSKLIINPERYTLTILT